MFAVALASIVPCGFAAAIHAIATKEERSEDFRPDDFIRRNENAVSCTGYGWRWTGN